jgi:hypothetical protein
MASDDFDDDSEENEEPENCNLNVIGNRKDVIGNRKDSIFNNEETEFLLYKNPQRKGKERKGKESTSRESATPEPNGSNGGDDETLPEKAEKPKGLSPLKDPTANYWQQQLTQIQPASTWGNIAKERKQCSELGKKTTALLQETPFESESELIDALLGQFLEMRQRLKADYWRTAAVVPSAIITRWQDITAALAERWQEEQQANEFNEVVF